MSGEWIQVSIARGLELSNALGELPRAMANKIIRQAVRHGSKIVMQSQKQGIPRGQLARGGSRVSYDDSGKPHKRPEGYMARAIIVRKKQGAAQRGRYTDVVQFSPNFPLLVTHSVGDKNEAIKSTRLLGSKKRTHGYKAGRRAYFYPASVEYGFRTRGGGKASGKRYLLKIARLKSSTAFAAIAAEIAAGIEGQMKAVAR